MSLSANPTIWYAARAAGIIAYLLLTFAVAAGVGLAGKKTLKHWPRFAVEDVHRFAGILTAVFVLVHVGAIALDSYLPFSSAQLVVPGLNHYRPVWTGTGIAAAELLLAIGVTNALRKRLPHRLWRTVHYLNFPVWLGATVHGLGAGTDRAAWWLLALYAVAVGTVSALTLWRATKRLQPRPLAWLAPAAGLALLPLVVLALPTGHGSGATSSVPLADKTAFVDSIQGQVLEQQGQANGLVSMVATAQGQQQALVRADLLTQGSQVQQTSLQVELLPSGARCSGHVIRVDSNGFQGVCLYKGHTRHVYAVWQLTRALGEGEGQGEGQGDGEGSGDAPAEGVSPQLVLQGQLQMSPQAIG